MRIAAVLRSTSLLLAAGLLVAAAVPAHAQMGAFQACYRNKPMPGGVTVTLRLVVAAPDKTMSGNVSFTQAVNPPLDVTMPVTGTYKDVKRGRHAAKLANPPMVGRQVKMALLMSSNWKAAVGTYSLWLDTPGAPKKGKVALRDTPCNP